jgi:hypothetical protein
MTIRILTNRMENPVFNCPYCAQENSLPADPSGGTRQTFVTDCEVCCRPIAVSLWFDEDGEPVVEAVAETGD